MQSQCKILLDGNQVVCCNELFAFQHVYLGFGKLLYYAASSTLGSTGHDMSSTATDSLGNKAGHNHVAMKLITMYAAA